MLLLGIAGVHLLDPFASKRPTKSELKYLTAKMAVLLPFGKVAYFLGALLPLSAKATAGTVRKRTMKVGERPQKCFEHIPSLAKLGTRF